MYWLMLFVQPVLIPMQPKKAKVMSCCAKKHQNKTHKGCDGSKDDCCGGGKCNPIFSGCPMCSPASLPSGKIVFEHHPIISQEKQTFPVYDQYLISAYLARQLRPPQAV